MHLIGGANMSGRVFISHSSADKPIARQIASELRNKGIDVWIDEKDIVAGSSIGDAVAEGIEQSDYFLILISGKSVQSRWVHEEASMAFQKAMEVKFPIIPIRLDGTAVPRIIKHLKYIDFKPSTKSGIDEILSIFRKDDRLASDRRKVSSDDKTSTGSGGLDCVSYLRSLSARDLRTKIVGKYDYDGIGVVWFDLFETKIGDEIPGVPLANAVISLIDKAKKRQKFDDLLSIICAEHPSVCSL